MKPSKKPPESFEFTERMNEVSGLGGIEERICRAIVTAGARWCAWHPHARLVFSEKPDERGFVRGVTDDARLMRQVIELTPFTSDDGRKVTLADEMTPPMFHTGIVHILYIASHGWNAYRERMSAPMLIVEDHEEQTEVRPHADAPEDTEGAPP